MCVGIWDVNRKGERMHAKRTKEVKAKVALSKMPFAELAKLRAVRVTQICRALRLPVDVNTATQRRQIEAMKRGGDRHFVNGLTLCPHCRHLGRSLGGPRKVGQVIMRYMLCTGPGECHFKMIEGGSDVGG